MNKLFSTFKKINVAIKKICLEIFIPHKKIRKILKADMVQHYLKKYVRIVEKKNQNQDSNKNIENYTIWQFWDKGIENAPKIVKECTKSIDIFERDKRHIILNMNNIKDYVEIPSKYYDLLKQNKMGTAHFSDILRTYLLIEHGGCWIDSTVLLTGKLPEYIVNSDLFLFQNRLSHDIDGLNIASYFIHSKPDNKILKDTRDVIEEYWKDNDFLMNYFLYLHAFTMVTNLNKNKEVWRKVPFSSFYNVQHFQGLLFQKYDDKLWHTITATTSIHKLSFKQNVLGLNKIKDAKDTFYDKFIKGELFK